jgi:acetylglutamate kinase
MKRVIKIGGRAQSSPDLADRIAEAWNEDPGSFCIVHGGGDEISAMQRRLGSEPSFVDGRRITTVDDIDTIRMVLSGLVNKRLVSGMVRAGIAAVGISGEDAGIITAVAMDAEGLGRAGKPVRVNAQLIQMLADRGYLPVISPLAGEVTKENGGSPRSALNVNGDDAAAAIAVALSDVELLFVADVAGVLDASGAPIAALDQTDTFELVQGGVINRGMRAKLEAGFAALAGGVRRVRISSLLGLSDPVEGTVLELAHSLAS